MEVFGRDRLVVGGDSIRKKRSDRPPRVNSAGCQVPAATPRAYFMAPVDGRMAKAERRCRRVIGAEKTRGLSVPCQ